MKIRAETADALMLQMDIAREMGAFSGISIGECHGAAGGVLSCPGFPCADAL